MSNEVMKVEEKKKRYAIVDMDALATLLDTIQRGDHGRRRQDAMDKLSKALRVQQGIPAEGLQVEATNRGFARIDFKDRYGLGCSLQKSSAAMFDAVWLGVNDEDAAPIVSGHGGWMKVALPEDAVVRGRMHLDKQGVAALLPHLLKFLAEGEI